MHAMQHASDMIDKILFVTLVTVFRHILESKSDWLNNRIINAAQGLLKEQYGIPGLQDTVLGSTLAFDVVGGKEFVQVLHSNGNHWLTVSTIGCSYSTVKVYDSLYREMPKSTIKQVCALLMSSQPNITLQFVPSDLQQNENDCGPLALAFCTALCEGKDPQGLQFVQNKMRHHLLICLQQGHMTPFPCKGTVRIGDMMNYHIPICCTCRNQEEGNMVQCERCKKWLHQECAGVPIHIWEDGSPPLVCSSCTYFKTAHMH